MSTAKRPWHAADLLRLEAVGEPQLSAGGRLAYVVQEQDAENDKIITRIWVGDPVSGATRPLTAGTSDRSPRWAPDGRRLAFVSDRSGKPQVWVIDASGGEARQLCTEQRVESAPVWSPDGTRIAFVSRQFPADQWEPYPGAPGEDFDRARRAAGDTLGGETGGQKRDTPPLKVITELGHKLDGAGYFGDLRRQVLVVTVPGEDGWATPPVQQVTSGCHDHQEPTWSPDGRFLAVTGLRQKLQYEDHLRMDLWRVEVATGELVQLVKGAGPISCPAWSPDGRWIAYIGHHQSHGRSTTPGLWLARVDDPAGLPLAPGDTVCLTAGLDRPVGTAVPSDVRYAGPSVPPVWEPDSEGVLFLASDRGVGKLYRAAVDGGGRQVLLGSTECSVAAFDAAGGTIAYQGGNDTRPDQIYLFENGTSRQVTWANRALMEEVLVSPARHFVFTGADGWNVDGWLAKPANLEPGRLYPMVLMIHGGPHGIYGHSFMFAVQLLVSSGFVVLYTNPRGSQSYGQAFASAVVDDWGGKDYQDLMAGVDAVLEQGLVDPARLGITGWSYGGYMTNWAITQTQRFAAAVTGASVFNLHNFYGTSDIGFTFGEFQWHGTPWEEPGRLLGRSPVAGVDRVTTPVLILHGESDLRCPVEQAEQLFTALRRLGKTAVMVRYPGESHALKRPAYRVDRYQRTLSWFAHYLQGV
ncbi:MAG: S9 family peptidase [Bacillota bacterium]